MRLDRRGFLSLAGLAAAVPAHGRAAEAAGRFAHGVASGDPQQDRVILWTRLTPSGAQPQAVAWEMATDRDFAVVAAKGQAVAGPERDFTVKADVTGLDPGTEYFYRFRTQGALSPVGRTRTLPASGVQDVVLAVASCASFPHGYFNGYQAIADEPRLDAVLHLGDYIYEYGGPGSYGMDSPVAAARPHDPAHEIVGLADYRRRHAQYKSDPQLQAAHARAPWIVVWDGHETANDSYADGAQNHQPEEGDWSARKAAALRAYYEWMPIREPAPGEGLAEAAMRSFHFGDLAALIMVETRLSARTQQLTLERDLGAGRGTEAVAAFRAKLDDPARRMMSPRQRAWIAAELSRSVEAGHAWQVLGNQVLMARQTFPDLKTSLTPEQYAAVPEARRTRTAPYAEVGRLGLPVMLDMWDGYPADRERLYDLAREAGARPIVLAGDSHAFWASDLHDAAGRRIACEFGASGITSPGAGEVAPGVNFRDLIAKASPEVTFCDQVSRGFVRLTLKEAEARADIVAVSTVDSNTFTTRIVKSFRTRPEGIGLSALSEV
jgi:alkaline phosphatase D